MRFLNSHGFNDASKRTAWIVCNGFLYAETHALILDEDYQWYDKLAQMVEESWDVQQVTEWVAKFAKGFQSFDELYEEVEIYFG